MTNATLAPQMYLADLKVGMVVSRSDGSIVEVTRVLPCGGVYYRGTWNGAQERYTSADFERFDLVRSAA